MEKPVNRHRHLGISVLAGMALLLALSASCFATESPVVTVRGGNGACVAGMDGDVCRHFYGGSDAVISVAGGGADCAPMKAVLMQMSSRLAAPVEGAIEPAAFDGCKGADVTVHLPKVDNETEFHADFSGSDGKAERIVVVPLKAYPRTLLDPLKSWAKNGDNALLVKDKGGKFTDFLDRNGVEYVAHGPAPQKARKVTIVVGDPEDMKDSRPDGDVLYIADAVKDVPLVTVERTAQGATAVAEVKLLDALAADDPLAEKALVKIFTMISK